MMKHDALTELRAIIKITDWSAYCPEKLRAELLDDWIGRWLIAPEFTQSVLHTKYLDSEYSDIIKTKLAQSLAEDLAENCISYKTADKKITASMVALRRKEKV